MQKHNAVSKRVMQKNPNFYTKRETRSAMEFILGTFHIVAFSFHEMSVVARFLENFTW